MKNSKVAITKTIKGNNINKLNHKDAKLEKVADTKNQSKETPMRKFLSVDTLSIKNTKGVKTIMLNGKKITTYGTTGASFFANEIEALPVNDLGYLHPIMVEFDETFLVEAKTNHLNENIVVALTVVDADAVEAFVTFMDPSDIDDSALHETFQIALEKVVADDKYAELYAPVSNPLSKTQKKALQKMKKESTDSTVGFAFSEIGYVQFTVRMEVSSFIEVFKGLDKIVANLEKKTRKLMQQH